MSNAVPMPSRKRVMTYWKTNGVERLTPRQRRRVQHKVNHAMAPFGKRTGS